MSRFSRPVLLCLFTLCLLMPHVWSEDKVRIKTENGVQVIINPEEPGVLPGIPSRMKIEKELVIGESSGRDEYMFGEARGIAVDDLGRISPYD